MRRLIFACCHCRLKILGNGNIGGDLLRKTCNICNLAAFLPDSWPQQRTMISRCSHKLRPMESFLTFLHLSSPCALPAAPNPSASCPSSSRTKLCHHPDGRRMMEKSRGQGEHPDPGSLLYVSQGVNNPLCKQSGQTSRSKLTFELPAIN